jgi:hypothetical protein
MSVPTHETGRITLNLIQILKYPDLTLEAARCSAIQPENSMAAGEASVKEWTPDWPAWILICPGARTAASIRVPSMWT